MTDQDQAPEPQEENGAWCEQCHTWLNEGEGVYVLDEQFQGWLCEECAGRT